MRKLSLILAAFLSLGAAVVNADDIVILERTASDFDTWGSRPDGRERVLTAISRETAVPLTTLEMQRNNTRLGYGGLFIANSLASATGQTFDEIAALKASGHGWGWIAKQNNVKLGPIVSRARNVDNAFKNKNGKLKKVKKTRRTSFSTTMILIGVPAMTAALEKPMVMTRDRRAPSLPRVKGRVISS